MTPEEKEESVKSLMKTIEKDNKTLHFLTNKRKEVHAMLLQKAREIEHVLITDISNMRESESRKRIKRNRDVEKKLQEITSALMMEFKNICEEDRVPRYIVAIANILDNYQGN